MSYTSPAEQAEQPVANLLEAIKEFRQVLMARLNNAGDWGPDHILECAEEIKQLTDLELRLRTEW